MGKKRTSKTTAVTIKPIVLLEDEPVLGHEQDELQLCSFSELIAGAAIGTRGPFTIGVYGTWGEGKTSVIKQASSLLDAQEKTNIITVWFNAWQYEHEEHPIVPLVASMVDQIERRLFQVRSKKEKVKDAVIESIDKIGRALRAVAYGFSSKAKIKIPGMAELEAGFVAKDMIDRDEQVRREDPLLDRTLYYNAFEMLKNAAPPPAPGAGADNTPRIIVFIDDLDRCLPDKAVRLLESIKLVLTQPGFIFVLAVDRTIIHHFVNAEFKRQLEGIDHGNRGVQYLDKIIQLPLPLPSHETRFNEYITSLLKRAVFADEINPGLAKVIEQLKGVLSKGVRHNPRSFVRLVNNLIVDRTLYAAIPEGRRMVIEEPELTGLFAVTRILQAQLNVNDDQLFDHLVKPEGSDLRESILLANDAHDLASERPGSEQDQEVVRSAKLRTHTLAEKIVKMLDDAPHLFALLKTEPGTVWLRADDKRKAVTHFLAETRKSDEKKQEAPPDQQTIVDRAIRRSLDLKENEPVTKDHRKKVTRLDCIGTPLDDEGLKIIGDLTALQELLISDTQVTELEPLRNLTALQKLTLGGTQVADIEPLRNLTNLELLWINSTQVTDLEPLRNLTLLRKLSLTGTPVMNLEPLGNLIALELLSLSGTNVTDLEPLQNLSALRTLWLEKTKVSDEQVETFRQTHPGCTIHR